MRLRVRTVWFMALAAAAVATPAAAADLGVAVAANFTAPAEEIAAAFKASTGHQVALSFGATGTLYTQVTQGAPFEVFLSADNTRPEKAVADGLGVDGTVFTYAIGTLVLFGPAMDLTAGEDVLASGRFDHIAIADPATAPYGAAAVETIGRLGLADVIEPREVVGQNVTQTLQFVQSGNAELGFVALSQVIDQPASTVWRVPLELYSPIRQDAVLLKTGADDPVAHAFIEYLRGPDAQAIIEKYGYGIADD